MPSRLLTQLAARIAATADPVEAACLRAQRSIYLARQGKRDEAEAIVRAIRDEFGRAPSAVVTAWISLAEALNHFYSNPGPQAMDRLKRADALSRAMNHPVLVPLCAAWLAHMEFNANHMEAMLQHAGEALRLAQPVHHAALARVSLVIADAFHFAGRFDLAKEWYAAVRDHALAEGDDAMISAMLHNIATFRANNVRLSDAFGAKDTGLAARAMLEAESTKNFDIGIGTTSLSLFVPLLRAQLLTIEGRYADALELFEGNLGDAETQGMARLLTSFHADCAWCNVNLGKAEESRRNIEKAVALAGNRCDPDDLATSYARIAMVLQALGQAKEATEYELLSFQYLGLHTTSQVTLLGLLLESLPNTPNAKKPT
jgi:tetratricopeptide (TPR) repeat protein